MKPTLTPDPITAIVGVTVIDGTGAPPMRDATVLIEGRRIRAVAPREAVRVPPDANAIDGRGLFVLPGFVDANIWGGIGAALRYGVTTVRGGGVPLKTRLKEWTRDSVFPRLLARGNVFGWEGGETVERDYHPEGGNFGVAAGLTGLDADSLRVRINQYLDTGVDYVKYGATTHMSGLISFSSRAQRVIVEEVHKRGLAVDIHATGVDGLRMAVLAGVDNIVHAEVNEEAHFGSDATPWPDDLVRLIVAHRVVCELYPAHRASFGPALSDYQSRKNSAISVNRKKLIRAGCTIAVISDGAPGHGTLQAIISLVAEYGMTPMAAIVAGTQNGARACKMLDQFGTITAGKLADLVVLRADPLRNIRNITQTVMVFAEGRRIDVSLTTRDRARDWDPARPEA